MRLPSIFRRPFQGQVAEPNRHKDLQPAGSRTLRAISAICASALVIASMGFGAVFAYTVGIEHGILLAGLTILMAVALEGIKPLAVASALTAFRSWAPIRGVLLTMLAGVAVLYSLTAELSLVAASRGDLTAKRAAVIESHDDRRDRIKEARAELATLAPARTVAEAQADVVKLLAANPKAGDCRSVRNDVARHVCAKVESLKGEQARSKRRADLQAVIDRNTDGAPAGAVVKSVDPGSSALSTYLAALGWTVPAGLLSDWLVLVPVLALELGAALALVLVQAVSGSSAVQAAPKTASVVDAEPTEPHQHTVAQPGIVPAERVDNKKPATKPRAVSKRSAAKGAKRKRLGQSAPASKEAVKLRLVDSLKAEGGRLDSASVRGVAKLIGAKKSTVHNAVAALVAGGVVAKVGTSLVLAAA